LTQKCLNKKAENEELKIEKLQEVEKEKLEKIKHKKENKIKYYINVNI